jgi:hypothetical protein
VSRLPKESAVTTFSDEALRTLARGWARAAVAEALGLSPRPAEGLAPSLEDARREVESLLRFGYIDVILLGRAAPGWRDLVARADSLLPRACVGCKRAVWPWERPFGCLVYRCQDCWQRFVFGARLVARAETEVETRVGLLLAFPNLDLDQ